MVFHSRRNLISDIEKKLTEHDARVRPLPGMSTPARRTALAMQLVASVRRFDFTKITANRDIAPERLDPNSDLFDPDRAAAQLARDGNIDEAVWVAFLSTHFGKHLRHGWLRMRDVYSGLGAYRWSWERVSADPSVFADWLAKNRTKIRGGFGNHRKYESLKPTRNGTGAVVASYVEFIGPDHSHVRKIGELVRAGGNDPRSIFDAFYGGMKVHHFGRLGKFDFLALIGRLKLAPIEPGSAYLRGASGPLAGSRLLFDGRASGPSSEARLENYLKELEASLDLGQDVLEDAICNWQKSPDRFVHFKG